jgi:hypothetical protein
MTDLPNTPALEAIACSEIVLKIRETRTALQKAYACKDQAAITKNGEILRELFALIRDILPLILPLFLNPVTEPTT